ncbi:hypothetical protein [Pseudomonas phage Rollin]|nr:hypothetical protein [Pseudomonas phage Rollin]
MSNLVPFNQAALPAHLQQAAGSAKANLIAATGTGGGSVDSISIKGGRFHVVRSGQQPVTLELFKLQVIIVHANPGVTKALFEGAWNPDTDAEAPICSSDDGVAPRADSEKPQCATCAACPQNQFGSKINPQTQKQTKACQDKKTIAVVTPGAAAGEMLRLQIPAASLKDFGNYLRSLPVAYHYVITEVSFDTTVSYPKLLFKPVDYVSAEEVAIVDKRHISDEAKAMAGVAGYTGAPVGAPINALPSPPAHLIAHQQVEQPVVQPTKTPEQIQMEALQVQLAALQGTVAQQTQPAQQPVVQQTQPAAQQTMQVAPLSDAPQPQDPSVAAIFGGQAAVVQPAAVAQQSTPVAQGNVHPSGREYGKPAPGRKRRTKVEMAEDAAVGIGAAPGEQSEEDDTAQAQVAQQQAAQPGKTPEQLALEAQLAALQAQLAATQQTPVVQQTQPAQQPAAGGFGQATQQQAQPIHQPANQPQVMTGGAADAFAGWDD